MKQILLLAVVHLLIYHQYQKDKKEEKFFTANKTEVAIKKEQKSNLSNLLQDLEVNKNESLFLFATGPVMYNFTDYSFLLQKNRD